MYIPITSGKVTGTGVVDIETNTFGGALISTNGTNSAVVRIRENDDNGRIVFDVSSLSAGPMTIPIDIKANRIWYSISGTGASAQLYEWKD